jgi:hypothetical protein
MCGHLLLKPDNYKKNRQIQLIFYTFLLRLFHRTFYML